MGITSTRFAAVRHRVRLGVVVGLAVGALVAAACGSGNGGKNASTAGSRTGTTSAGSGSASTTSDANPDDLPVFISIDTCDNHSGTGTSTGTIENQGSSAVSFRFELNFTDASSGEVLGTGSYVTGIVAAGATTNYVVSAGPLGNSELTCKTKLIRRADSSGDATTSSAGTSAGSAGAVAEAFPCNVLSPEAIKALTGNALDGDATTNHVSENGTEWTARTCTWTAMGVTNPTEATLNVARSGDFKSGKAECPGQPADTTPVSGIGDRASWSWTNPGTTIKTGKLRVCSSSALVDVDVSGPGTEDSLQRVAKGVAVATLSKV